MQSSTGRSRVASAILKASKKGGELANCGVMGRLGDLASIDEQYDVAVSTACGMLDHIVVQTTAGTQKCLEFLRKHNLGRASFVPLDKMKKGAHDRAVDTPEGAPRLFDLISPGHFSITPALYLAVGNTLVAPDLETATRWAYEYGKRWRVVTLDGKLIETSGTMSGGGKSVQKGKMKLSVSLMSLLLKVPPFCQYANLCSLFTLTQNGKKGAKSNPMEEFSTEDCKKLEEQANAAQNELKSCRTLRRELTDEIRSLNKRIKALSVKIPQLQMEIAGFDTSREELTKRLPALREESTLSDADQEKKEELVELVEKCKSEMASCVSSCEKLGAEVAKLQKNIINAGGSKLKNQQKACDKAKKTLADANKALNSAKSTITNSNKTIQKAEKALASAEVELEKSKEALETMQTEHEELESGAKELMEAYEEVKKDEAAKRKALESVSKEHEKLKSAQQKLKCAEVELNAKIENLDKAIKDSNKKVTHWGKEIRQLVKVERQEENEWDLSDDEEEDEDERMEEPKEKAEEDEDDAMEEVKDEEVDEDGAEPKSVGKDEEEIQVKGPSSLPQLSDASLEQYSTDSIRNDIAILEKERDTLAKNTNMGAIAEYRKKEADYLSR